MSSQGVIFDLNGTQDRRFDRIIETILVGLLAFMPLALGAVHPWSELVVIAAAAAMVLVLLAKLLVRPDVRFVWTWAYVPVLGFVGLVAVQLVPLPAGLAGRIAPAALELRSELLEGLPGAGPGSAPARIPLSFYPQATFDTLRMLLALSAIFIVTINVVRRLEQVKRLLAAIAIIGAGVALIALAQNITEAPAIYWLIPLETNQATSGPFRHHGHFAQFMNLSMGAALGLMLMHLDQLPRWRRGAGAWAGTRALARPVTQPIWMLACAVVAMAVCVPLSLSRGGMVAMLAAGTATALVLATRRGMRGRTWIFIGIVVAALAVVLLFDFDAVLRRAASLGDREALGGRVEILHGSIEMWRKFPLAGTGLGTFGVMFPMFDSSRIVKTAQHAENEYAQLLVETGAIGAVLLLAFVTVMGFAYARSVGGGPSPMASGAIGLGFGLLAILVHSAGDFGQHIPANAVLSAVAFALLLTLAQATQWRHTMPQPVVARGARWPRLAAGVLVLPVVAAAVWGAVRQVRADEHHRDALRRERALAEAGWRGSDREFAGLILAAQRAAELRPADVVYRYLLNWYRWKALARGLNSGSSPLDEREMRHLRRVVDELLACPRLCPTYAPPYLLAGQLRHALLGDSSGERLIRRAQRLEPANPQTIIAVAVLDAQAGRWSQTTDGLRRAMTLSPDHRQPVIDVALDELHRPELALSLAGDDRGLLLRLAETLERRGQHPAQAEAARHRAERLLLEEAHQPDASVATLADAAQVALRAGDYTSGTELLRRATTIDYGALDLRLKLARALATDGRTDQAIAELRNIIRQSPSHAEANALLADLHPATTRPPASAPATLPAFKLE